MKIGIAQINSTVGDFENNLQKMKDSYQQLVEMGAEWIIFPELVICGYPPRDLLLKQRFIDDMNTAVLEFSRETNHVPALIGFAEQKNGRLYNAASLCQNGQIIQSSHKCLLPTYDVFDEKRYFTAAKESLIVDHNGKKIAITICEDLWNQTAAHYLTNHDHDPVEALVGQGIDIVFNLSASPWHHGKEEERQKILHATATRCNCPVVYVNAVGGNDELIFDGGSTLFSPNGRSTTLEQFQESIQALDTENISGVYAVDSRDQLLEKTKQALILGLRDYTHKSGFKKAIIGLSGGIDSALTAAIAVEALGTENITGISLPSNISSQHSRDDARDLAQNLGIAYHTLPIASVVESAENELADLFAGRPLDVTEENLQARSRGLLLMAVSNKLGALLLTTGNKSELAVGYCTLYGDMCGGLAVIADLPKTLVFDLCRYWNKEKEIIPWNTIEKPPSAELREGQLDEDSLPPYDELDRILHLYIEKMQSGDQIIEQTGFDETVVREIIRKVDLNEYKRKQAAPGLKVTSLAFGVGRRIPIVQRYIGK